MHLGNANDFCISCSSFLKPTWLTINAPNISSSSCSIPMTDTMNTVQWPATCFCLAGLCVGFTKGCVAHKNVYGELKSGFAFAAVPTQNYHSNSAWQVLNLMAFNISRAMRSTAENAKRLRTRNLNH